MNLALSKKVFLIAGASRGIGKTIAIRFLEEGAIVILLARSAESLEATVKELERQFPRSSIFGYAVDCCDELALEQLKPQILKNVNHLDGIVLNVGSGISVNDAIPSATQWDSVWQCNFESAIKPLRIFLTSRLPFFSTTAYTSLAAKLLTKIVPLLPRAKERALGTSAHTSITKPAGNFNVDIFKSLISVPVNIGLNG